MGRGGGGDKRNKTALRQSSVLALVVKTKYIYCSAAVTMHHGMVTKSANKIFLWEQSSPLPHHLCVVFFLFFLTKKWQKEMGWENAIATFICSSLLTQLWVLNSSVYLAFDLMFPKWIAIEFCKLFIITLLLKYLWLFLFFHYILFCPQILALLLTAS